MKHCSLIVLYQICANLTLNFYSRLFKRLYINLQLEVLLVPLNSHPDNMATRAPGLNASDRKRYLLNVKRPDQDKN